MTFDERVTALASLGLPPRQTALLATVILNGGYCLRRQFDAFVGGVHGQLGRNLFDTLVDRDLATPLRYQPNRGRIFHVHTKSLYRALQQDDNRNRRVVSAALIARKLMVLDYVLTASPAEWLATEDDKVALFTTRFGIGLGDLPQRRYESASGQGPATTRYFVHKLPMRLTPDGLIHFVHLVEDETGRHFDQFLADHVRLLSRVPAWTIVLVCPPHLKAGGLVCERVFHRTFALYPSPSSSPSPSPSASGSGSPSASASPVSSPARSAISVPDRDELRWFFTARQAVDQGDLRGLSVADLDRFRDLRSRLTTAPFERLYVEWQRAGDGALAEAGQIPASEPSRIGVVIHDLPWRYRQFGTFPGAA
jgi:hypothetical protein